MSRGNTTGGGFVPPSPEELDAILDAYEFIEMLGRGGMGAVYKARQKSLDRLVAIKILPPDLAEDDAAEDGFRFAERFQREARAMARLNHPNIISVYDFGQAVDGQCYFVMEYIEGTDLHSLIQGGGMTVDHVAGWMSQICDALQYAHSRGIVHRDIKPANIMITREGQVKVADFGLAKLTGPEEVQTKLTMTHMAMGTPDYVAPEVLEAGVEVDHRADLYAVGVMLYEMLTGKVPRGAWKAASTQVPGLDPRYDDLIEKAMDADREGRYQHASEIGATLYEIATSGFLPATAAGESASSPESMIEMGPATRSEIGNRAGAVRSRPGVSPAAPLKSKRSPAGWAAAALALPLLAAGAYFFLKKEPVPAPAPVAATAVDPALPSTPAPASATVLPASPTADPSRFAGVQFPRDLGNPSSKAWRFEDEGIVLDAEVPVEFPSFQIPVSVGAKHEFEMVFSRTEEAIGDGYLIIIIPVRAGWISVQIRKNDMMIIFGGQRKVAMIDPVGPGVKRTLTIRNSTTGDMATVTAQLDGGLPQEVPASGDREILNWKQLSVDRITIGGETKGASPLVIHSLRVTRNAAPQPSGPATPPVEPPGEDQGPGPFNETMSRLLDGVEEIDFGERIAGDISVKGGEVTTLFSTNEGRVYGVAAERPNDSLPRVVATTHGYFLQDLASKEVCRRFFRNSMEWLSGEGKPVVLISPDELPWPAKGWAVANGYEVLTRPPEGGGGVLIIAENRCYETPERRKLIREMLPQIDGIFTSLTSWANINPNLYRRHPSTEIFDPYGFELLFRRIEPTGNWTRPPGLPSWRPATASPSAPGIPDAPSARSSDPLARITEAGRTDPRLGQLATGFLARLEKDAEAPHRAAVESLDRSYVANGLARARAAAQAGGSLEVVTAIDAEKARVESGEPVPASDEPALVESVKALRSTYREALGKLELERVGRAGPVYDLYLGALDTYVTELTQANEIERARSVKRLRDEVASLKPSLAAPAAVPETMATTPPAPDARTPPAPSDTPALRRSDREVAESLLQLGGVLRLSRGGGSEEEVKTLEALPTESFEILGMDLDRLNSNRPVLKRADFAALVGPRTLRRVWVRPMNATPEDEDFAFLAGNENLEYVDLEGTELVTDAVLDHLRDSKSLKHLAIQYATRFTGEGLADHPAASTLTSVSFLASGITDEGIAAIARCRELTIVRLTLAKAEDEAFALLAGLPKLETLDVVNTGFGDKAAAAISPLESLAALDLSQTAITDRGLAALAGMKQLRSLTLTGCDLSEKAVEELRQALPDCRIQF